MRWCGAWAKPEIISVANVQVICENLYLNSGFCHKDPSFCTQLVHANFLFVCLAVSVVGLVIVQRPHGCYWVSSLDSLSRCRFSKQSENLAMCTWISHASFYLIFVSAASVCMLPTQCWVMLHPAQEENERVLLKWVCSCGKIWRNTGNIF